MSLDTLNTISVVMPFYNKYFEFEHALPLNASYLSSDSIEVVLVVDEPYSWVQLEKLIARLPQIHWKVLTFSEEHPWRNPAPVINTGIRYAMGEYVMVVSPESVFATDLPKIFLAAHKSHREKMLQREMGKRVALTGVVQFLQFGQALGRRSMNKPYGSIFFRREDAIRIQGYDEKFTSWGGDDDEFRRRLHLSGTPVLPCPEAQLLHFESEQDFALRESRDSERIMHRRQAVQCIHDYSIDQPEFGALDVKVVQDWRSGEVEEHYSMPHDQTNR